MSAVPHRSASELDVEVLRRAQAQDRQACTAFVAQYERRVFAALSRIAGPGFPAARLEELAQDTFVRALRGLPRFSPSGPAKLSSWVLTIATRVALNELRRARPALTPLHAAPDRPGPDEHQHFAIRDALRRAIETLTPEQRAVVVLHDLHGLSDSEVAGALSLTLPATKSRLLRARARLRTALGEGDQRDNDQRDNDHG